MEDEQTLKLAGLGLRATAVIIDTAILFGGEAVVFFTYFSAEALKAMGMDLSGGLFTLITIQTDNGAEFIGCIFKKLYHSKHQTIPVGKKEYNGSVENFH